MPTKPKPHTVTVVMPGHEREVTLSTVEVACGWCGRRELQQRYPGSFVPVLCPRCRKLYRAWQRANYHRRDTGLDPLTLAEWAALQRARHRPAPEVPAAGLSDGLGLAHAPANAAGPQPVRGARAKDILARREARRRELAQGPR
jgi:hypothetical protein